MANTHCPDCGYNFAAFGRVHRCIPKQPNAKTAAAIAELDAAKAALPHKQDSVPGQEWDRRSTRQSAGVVKPPTAARAGIPGTYKYRDADKRRAYMRGLMRKRRGK